MDIEEIKRRKAAARARKKRRRAVVAAVACAAMVALVAVGYVKLRPHQGEPQASTPVARATQAVQQTPGASATATVASAVETLTPAPTPKPTPTPHKTFVAAKPHIVADFIPFGAKRRQQMAEYSQRRYGDSSIVLRPKVIVLHYTAGGTAASVHDLFASNTPNGGELPGVVAHFIVDKDGTVYQELPLDIRGRHAIGLNQVAIGIEFVQEDGSGPEWADQQILDRKKQMAGGLALVAWLQAKFGIQDRDVIGHASANDSRYFKDLAGKTNDHGDWLGGDAAQFRKALRKQRGE